MFKDYVELIKKIISEFEDGKIDDETAKLSLFECYPNLAPSDTFAHVYWSQNDFNFLYDQIDLSQNELDDLLTKVDEDELCDRMIAAGWDYLQSVLYHEKKDHHL